ncbi:MAG TPA: hypothetical protein ENI11_03160, partial [Actinobacteria bacterium]|nr:hypothetical protein [Actinomycetota bacterium]
MTKRFWRNKKMLAGLSLIILALALGSCRSTEPTENPIIKQKKTTALSARQVAKKFWGLMNKGDFGPAYSLVDPKSRKKLSKKNFIKASDEIAIKPKVKVGSVIVNGRDANIALFFRKASGEQTVSGKIVYYNKKWYQELETDLLISYGVHPKNIPFISEA